ncbi:MAG: T9SS C-terminal target domain-containing protein [Calditrichaeota bacterium]|nr:MAG: T9SS C-terminal target domain-containing protein [Calditrichota bacterium]MBL1207202.1 T9SS C-terminal target domain-containing protein [Calditrichota bacterium]NOG47035.1 T9SS type A sorting domain-containing protein [Calditrichota bacterium]
MYVKSTGSATSTIYASCKRDGLQVISLDMSGMGFSYTITQHLYDADKADADKTNSTDASFDFRNTHSAWPTDDGAYVFTTDELSVWPPDNENVNLATDVNLYVTGVLKDAHRQGDFLRTWKTSQLGTSSALKSGHYAPQGQAAGVTDLTSINNTMVPSSVHQMYAKGNCLYIAHYAQGMRVVDIYDPESPQEIGYYDDYPTLSVVGGSDYFFRKSISTGSPWYQGVYGVYPDPNRPGIVYAGSFNKGFYIFDVLPTITTPTGVSVSGNPTENPIISWNASTDTGLDGYKLYRSLDGGAYNLLITLDRNTTSFEDGGVIIGSGKFAPYACYKVSAFNITGRESAQAWQKCTQYSGLNKSGVDPLVSENDNTIPKEFNLKQAYPNPFNPSTKISYDLPENTFVNLVVYNMLGMEVALLVNRFQESGRYTVEFNAKHLPSGSYIYRIKAGLFTDKKKIVLVK